jgi:uncharacterized membrane protein YeaQ/YmgE (transglycosylase-associated protein family)
MTLTGFLILLLVAAICGVIAKAIVGFYPGGLLASIGIGFMGAFIGTWLARALHLPSLLTVQVAGTPIEIFWTVLGAILLLLVVMLFHRASWRSRYV